MKKTITTLLLIAAVQLTITPFINAQVFAKNGFQTKMKADVYRSEFFAENYGNTVTSVDNRVMKSFQKEYASVSNVEWYSSDEFFVARFRNAGKTIKAYYTPKGDEFAVVSTYEEKQLPGEIRKLVKSNYYDFTITQVIEIKVDGKTAYLVQMEDEKTLLTVRVMDMELTVYSTFDKAK